MINFDILRSVNASFLIDTNHINVRGKNPYINQLETWYDRNIIILYTPEATFSDLSNEGNSGWSKKRKDKARQRPIVYPFINIDRVYQDVTDSNNDCLVPEWEKEFDRRVYAEIEEILYIKDDQNTRNDINIVYSAWESKSILVTNDGASNRQSKGILGNSDKLKEGFNIVIMRDFESVEYVRLLIKKRDECILHGLKEHDLLGWVGKD
ncbi:MAG: hypothetical protein A2Y21_07535 [Clostridiales bacterium GWC2_40_7]|nr:MAG: hypothetical protein A2Y21_07535 [Clostridiales bacterium GWC2_40_7]